MSCQFYDSTLNSSLEQQILNYCINLVPGSGTPQRVQVTLYYSPEAALLFEQTRCSDIVEILLDEPEGNRQLYVYNEIEIWVYKVVN